MLNKNLNDNICKINVYFIYILINQVKNINKAEETQYQ